MTIKRKLYKKINKVTTDIKISCVASQLETFILCVLHVCAFVCLGYSREVYWRKTQCIGILQAAGLWLCGIAQREGLTGGSAEA